MDPIILIAFLVILSILVFVHELGHFVVAKRSGITVEEFAIGFPPRAVKLWQDEGQITLDGHEYVIGRKLNVPRTIQPGAQVYAETAIDAKGRPAVTKLELVTLPSDKEAAGQPNSETKLFGLLSRGPAPTPAGDRPVITVDALIRPTEYTINWIPFGGYVRMVGEEDPSAAGSFAGKSKKIRFAVLVAGSLMNLVAAVVFFTLSSMSGVREASTVTGLNLNGQEAAAAKTVITQVLPDTPAAQASLKTGDVIMGADDVEFNYTGDFSSYVQKVDGKEITLHLNREGQTLTIPLIPRINQPTLPDATGINISGIEYDESVMAKTVITDILPDTPAATANLKVDDIIIGADESEFKYVGDLVNYIEKKKGQEVTLRLDRKGEIVTAAITPRVNPPEGQGAMGIAIGYGEIVYYSLPTALAKGISQTALYMALPFYLPIAIFRNEVPAEVARPTGPVGIYRQTASSVSDTLTDGRWSRIFTWTAILSAALAITNLLPLPALDGGRILFILIEAIRGKRVAPEKEGAVHFIGLVLLLTAMLVITYYDIIDPIPTISLF